MNEQNTDSLNQTMLNRLIARYLEREQAGETINRDEILQWHPELSDDLRSFFANHDRMQAREEPAQGAHAPTIPATPPAGCNLDTIPPTATPIEDKTLPPQGAPATNKNRSGESVRYFGNYELLEEIARGGMGVVYKARQTKLNRFVALKMILAGQLAGEEDVKRFHTEAEAAANLDHPGIVPIYEIGEHDGQHYFSMAFVEGSSLAAKVAQGPLPPTEAVELTKKVAEAIHYAHQKDVIHRDLKPGNILLDEQGEPKVTDFGLAKKLEGDGNLTSTGQILGTPSYMPPEQAAGKSNEISSLADVYSLGAILYCLLTGRPPFQAANPMDTLLQVLEREPVPLRQMDRSIPRDLETICQKCLSKETHRRYGSAQELADDLGRWLGGEPISARPVTRIEKTWLWCKRRPAIAGSALAVAVTILVAISVLYAQRSVNQRRRAASLVQTVLTAQPEAAPYACRDLEPVRGYALEILRQRFNREKPDSGESLRIACALSLLGQDEHEFLVAAIGEAANAECGNICLAFEPWRDLAIPGIRREAKRYHERQDWRRKTKYAIVALYLGDTEPAADMLQIDGRPDPIQRTIFIDTFPKWRGDLIKLAALAEKIDDGSLRSGICLGMGSIPVDQVPPDAKEIWRAVFANWYQNMPDTATHSATGWALKQWNDKLPRIAASKQPIGGRDWYVNSVGMTMLKIPAGTFVRRDPRYSRPRNQQVTLTRSFLLSDREVSRKQFKHFIHDPNYPAKEKLKDWKEAVSTYSPTDEHPVQLVNWYDAILFCNWLSDREGLKPCYVRTGEKEKFLLYRREIEYDVWRLIPEQTGYRLPTEAEWEYACRAGATTKFNCGDDESLLDRYAVHLAVKPEIPGGKLPNGWGLFDLHGNLSEWCHDRSASYGYKSSVIDPIAQEQGINRRILRGGQYQTSPQFLRSGNREERLPIDRSTYNIGFRVARTHKASGATDHRMNP